MPRQMGRGRRNLAARRKARSWVLSPISARATMPVETRKAFNVLLPAGQSDDHAPPRPSGGDMVKGLAKQEPLAPWPRGQVCCRTPLHFCAGRLLPKDAGHFTQPVAWCPSLRPRHCARRDWPRIAIHVRFCFLGVLVCVFLVCLAVCVL